MKNPQYHFVGVLGRGSFGEVHKAFDAANRLVAVKMVELDTEFSVEDTLMEMRVLREMRHSNVVQLFDVYLNDSVLWLVMEYCAAGSCISIVKSLGPMREESALWVIGETLKGLEYVHSQGKIHRDIKGANILVGADAAVKVADFGVTAQLTQTMPERDSFMGTPYWMAPEIIKSSYYGTMVDIWSLGIVAIELVVGRVPLWNVPPTRALMRIVDDPPPRLAPDSTIGFSLSPAYCQLVASCLQKDPARRPSATELRQSLPLRSQKSPPQSFQALVRRILIAPSRSGEHEAFYATPTMSRTDLTAAAGGEEPWSFDIPAPQMPSPASPITPGRSPRWNLAVSTPASGAKLAPAPPVPPRAPIGNAQALHAIPQYLLNQRPADQVQQSASPRNAAVRVNENKPRPAGKRSHKMDLNRRDAFNHFIDRALLNVRDRAKKSAVVPAIDGLRRHLGDFDRQYPGFTTALLEELWIRFNE